MVSNLKQTVTFFKHSMFALAHLSKARKDDGITTSLVSIGRTRFGSHWMAAVALEKCIPQIQDLLDVGIISAKVNIILHLALHRNDRHNS